MNNRNMFYQNSFEGYSNPGGFIPPSGYNMNTNYYSYGPNEMPNTISNQNDNIYENRINKLERQVKNLDTRLQKIENSLTKDEDLFSI